MCYNVCFGTMTDESVLISLVKLQVRKLKLDGYNLSDISDEEIMISNLPLLFADGYPTCLEKFTLRQLEKFVPFMLQCSLGQNYLHRYTTTPKWWPKDLPFSVFVKKPVEMDDTCWFAMLKSIVCRCYTYHGCEFMLRFCTELSKCPSSTYVFAESLDGTTSLYNKDTGRLMVTFRNENRDYDKEVESSPRRWLVPKSCSQNSSRIKVQPPVFDIYLCDNCDGEFDSLTEVQEHEKTCGKHQISQEVTPEEQPQQHSQDSFLYYFSLKSVNSEDVPKAMSPVKKISCKRRYPAGVTFTRCCGVPFSSPLGIAIQKVSRMTAVNPQVLLDRMERYCVTNTQGPSCRSREREFEDRVQEGIEWPITWKPPNQKKAQDAWTHYYCFTVKESYERMARKSSRGLNKRSQKLLSMCRDVRVVVVRLTEDDILELTTRVPTPKLMSRDSESTFQLPTLLPNTMYAYNTSLNIKNHYPEPIALSPQATIPVIDLCSTDEEEDERGLDEVEPLPSVPLVSDESGPLILALAGDKYVEQNESGVEVEPVFCDKNSASNIAVYPSVETSYETCAQMETSSSCLDDDTFMMQYSNDPSLRFSKSAPHGWQTKTRLKTPPSPSPAPTLTHEEKHVTYSPPLHCNSTDFPLQNLSSSERIQTKSFSMTTSEETFDCDVVEEFHTPLLRHNATDCLKLYNAHVPLVRTRIDTRTKTRLSVPSSTSTALSSCSTGTEKSNSKLSFPHRKEKMLGKVISTTTDSSLASSESSVEAITGSQKSRCSLPFIHKKKQTFLKVCSTSSSEESFYHDHTDAHLSLYEGKEKVQNNLLRTVSNTSLPVSTHEDCVLLDDTMNTTAPHHSVTTLPGTRVQYQSKLSNTTPPSPSPAPVLDTDGSIAVYASLQSDLADFLKTHKSDLSVPVRREQSRSRDIMTPLPATASAFSQGADGITYTPLHRDPLDDTKTEHSNFSSTHKRERTRFATKRASKQPQPVEDSDSLVPGPKKPNLQVYNETVPGMESTVQDTSNSDVFGVSVKHGKAAEPLQRCLAKRSSPVYIRQLHQDECRELRRRGLKEVMNRSGRVLRGQLVDGKVHPKVKYIAHFSKIYSTNDCCQKNEESVKVENLFSQEEL